MTPKFRGRKKKTIEEKNKILTRSSPVSLCQRIWGCVTLGEAQVSALCFLFKVLVVKFLSCLRGPEKSNRTRNKFSKAFRRIFGGRRNPEWNPPVYGFCLCSLREVFVVNFPVLWGGELKSRNGNFQKIYWFPLSEFGRPTPPKGKKEKTKDFGPKSSVTQKWKEP